jgi:hypothetical protein
MLVYVFMNWVRYAMSPIRIALENVKYVAVEFYCVYVHVQMLATASQALEGTVSVVVQGS